MTVGANTYAEREDVERLIGDIVPSRTFTESTTPSLAQAEAELDNVAAEINAELDAAGYTVPISETGYPVAYKAAGAANAYGAAARLLSTSPAEAFDADEQIVETGENRPQQYEKLLNRFLKRIREYRLRAGYRKGRLSRAFAGASEDADGYNKQPMFTRDMDRYPGREPVLTDEEGGS